MRVLDVGSVRVKNDSEQHRRTAAFSFRLHQRPDDLTCAKTKGRLGSTSERPFAMVRALHEAFKGCAHSLLALAKPAERFIIAFADRLLVCLFRTVICDHGDHDHHQYTG